MDLLVGGRAAIAGSEFKAVNNRDRNFTHAKIERRRAQIAQGIARCLAHLDPADRQERSDVLAVEPERLWEKIARLGKEMRRLGGIEAEMLAASDQLAFPIDPDARSMATSGRGSGIAGYNMYVAVETEHHLVVAHAVMNAGSDRAVRHAQEC